MESQRRQDFRGWFALTVILGSLFLFCAYAKADGWTGYVTRESPNVLVPFDSTTGQLGTTIPSVASPRGMVIAPDGGTAYVTTSGPNRIVPFALPSGEMGEPIAMPKAVTRLAITPDGSDLYATSTNAGEVYRVDLATGEVDDPIEIGSQAWGIAITPDGTSAYVTTGQYPSFPDSYSGIARVDLASGTVTAVGETNAAMSSAAVLPDGSAAFGISSGLNRAYRAEGNSIVGYTPAGSQASEIAISPDGEIGLVVNFTLDQVSVLDLVNNTALAPIPVGEYPVSVSISPDSKTGWVTARDGESITPVNLETLAAGPPISLGEPTRLVAITPNQPPTAEFSAGPAQPGQAVELNASASTDPDGEIALYAWDFGDGQSAETTGPVVSHTYAEAGDYTATLTLTDDLGCSTEPVYTGQMASCGGRYVAEAGKTIKVQVPEPPFCESHPTDPQCQSGGDKPLLGPLKVIPKKKILRRGKKAVFTLKARNIGKAIARDLRVCVNAPKRVVRVKKCARSGALVAGATATYRFTFRAGAKFRPKRNLRVTFKLTARNLGSKKVTARVLTRR